MRWGLDYCYGKAMVRVGVRVRVKVRGTVSVMVRSYC